MKRRFQWSYIPSGLIGLASAAYLGLLGLQMAATSSIGAGAVPEEIRNGQWFQDILVVFLFVAGFQRVWRFFPRFNLHYARWLSTTPWTHRQVLPLGPVHLMWQDLLILAAVVVLDRFHLGRSGAIPLVAFFLAYFLTTLIAHLMTKPNLATYLVFSALPVGVLLIDHEWWLVGVAAAVYPFAALGTAATLRGFPWQIDAQIEGVDAGWPFNRIGPFDPKDQVSYRAALIVSVFVAWIIFCAATWGDFSTPDENYSNFHNLFLFAGVILAVLRFSRYFSYGAPPISLLGRIRTGRIVIPGYDKIFVAPLVILLASILAPRVLLTTVYPPLACALIGLAIFFPFLALPPSLARWRLTGTHRILRPANTQRQSTQRADSANIQFRLS